MLFSWKFFVSMYICMIYENSTLDNKLDPASDDARLSHIFHKHVSRFFISQVCWPRFLIYNVFCADKKSCQIDVYIFHD